MYKLVLVILAIITVTFPLYRLAEAEENEEEECEDAPADADFHPIQKGDPCFGMRIINMKACCCKCRTSKNPRAHGRYCNQQYCPKPK